MRTGAEYLQALHDGPRIWVIGEGLVEDATWHPATPAVVDECVAWYDCHFDPEWQNIALTPPGGGDRSPWGSARIHLKLSLISIGLRWRCFFLPELDVENA